MGLEGAIRHYPTDSIEIDPGGDDKIFYRRGERERISAVYIRDRAPNPNLEVKLDHGPALLSCRELKNSRTGAYRLLFWASFFSSQPSEESIARVNSELPVVSFCDGERIYRGGGPGIQKHSLEAPEP